jgi:hypothetical protein
LKIVKANKVLTSEALNAEMIVNENIRKANENARNVYEDYNPSEPYIKGNKVVYNGSSYLNKLACTGIIPTNTTYWLCIAAAGAGLTDASQLAITDTGNYYNTDNTGDALQEVGQRIGNLSLLETESNTDLVSAINENTNQLAIVVSPDNFSTLQDAIDYCKLNNKTLTTNLLTLTQNTNIRSIGLNINVIALNGFTLELGGDNVPDLVGQAAANPEQRIGKIIGDVIDELEKVFIRGAIGQHITIGQYYGMINLRMNETDTYNAYSTFNFGTIYGVHIKNDTWVSASPSVNLWCNENEFYLNRCRYFIMDGTYDHDLNRVHGGTFEGNSAIEIIKGKNNHFYDMRFEGGNVTVHFYPLTSNNIIERNDGYYINLIREGVRNSVIYTQFSNSKMLNQYSIKIDTFNATYMNGFKNLVLSADSLGLKGNADQALLLETEFIDNPNDAMFYMECTRKVGFGLALKYRVYDINFNDISSAWSALSKTFYYNSCAQASIATKVEGSYILPNAQTANTTTGDVNIYNDKIMLYPTTNWQSYLDLVDGTHPEIKYVKFFVIRSDYFNPSAEVYNINAKIYDLSSNYHYHYSL